jgi:hypothetical protein
VVVIADQQGRKGLVQRWAGSSRGAVMTFKAKLSPGRWIIIVTGTPASGYATPQRHQSRIMIRASH